MKFLQLFFFEITKSFFNLSDYLLVSKPVLISLKHLQLFSLIIID